MVPNDVLTIEGERMLQETTELEVPILELSIEASDNEHQDFMGFEWRIK